MSDLDWLTCRRGHPFAEAGSFPSSKGRQCRVCRNLKRREGRLRIRQGRYLAGWAAAIDGDVAHVPLGGDRYTLVDVADVEAVSAYRWRLHLNGYARAEVRSGGVRTYVYLHRLVCPTDLTVDHINRDPLDNRRANLRPATRTQQLGNTGLRSTNTSGYRGVSRTRSGRWGAWIRMHGRSVNLGTFDTPEQASAAYRIAAREYFGEFANG